MPALPPTNTTYGYTTWDPGWCNCCDCEPCPIPQSGQPFSLSVFGGALAASGTLTFAGSGTWPCEWYATGNLGTHLGHSYAYEVFVFCQPGCTSAYVTIIEDGTTDTFYYWTSPSGCNSAAGAVMALSGSSTCSPLSLIWTCATNTLSLTVT